MPAHEIRRTVAAFFDLDLTLLGINSARHWIEYERKLGQISRWQLAEAVLWIVGYKLGIADVETGILRAIRTLEGRPEAALIRQTEEWYNRYISRTILPAGRETLARHREQGHYVVLLTSTSSYIGAMVQRDLDLDAILCTDFEVRNERFTGGVVPPLCYGKGKVVRARKWADETGVDLDRCYFYTDSLTDLPMLEAVGYPHAVNPDARLRREARRRGWPVDDWIRSQKQEHNP